MRKRVYEILEPAGEGDWQSRVFDWFILSLIVLNVVAVVLETVKSFAEPYGRVFAEFERFSVIVFTIEYVLRLWACTADAKYSRTLVGRLRFAMRPMILIDAVAILPFYLPAVVGLDLRFVRALRLFRLLRVLKAARYSEAMTLIAKVFLAKKAELAVGGMVLAMMLLFASSLMYHIECEAQPEVFSSIPASMWWGVATLTTVGYGDVYPVTPLGRLLASVIAILGIGLFALPAGILASGFEEALKSSRKPNVCPHCSKELES